FIERDGTDVGSSVGLMVNELSKYIERKTRDARIGIPLGKRSLGEPIPANVEALYSGMSIELATANVEGLKAFFMGAGDQQDGESFYEYLVTIDAQFNGELLGDVIRDQFDLAISETSEIPAPFSETVETNPTPAEEAHEAIQKLVVLIKADMSSALGVVITYQDNDGD
ncbi:MAG: imelysin family protein, partial [Fulvivirga sp.]|nr:imelysin family protein [Fulvivirga sp.]